MDLIFNTGERVFSPNGIDKGTLAMLSVVEFGDGDRVLDLGCGYGVVGILAARLIGAENVVMTDVNEYAVALSQENAALNGIPGAAIYRSDGFKDFQEKDFTVILSNPPYHADFNVPRMFIEKGFNRLRIGGRFYMVTKRKEWYKNKFIAVFGGVKVWEIDGYFVFLGIKKQENYAKKAK